MRLWILESNWRSIAWQETRPGTKQRLSLAAKQPKRFLSGFTQPQRTPILSWIQLDTIPILFFTSPSYPNICAPQATVDKACLGSFTSAQLAESRMFDHKQKPEKVREGHKAAGSARMTLSFPPPTHTCHLAQLSTKQAMQETPNWNARTAVRCCQCATICFFGTCSSTYKLSLQAPVINGYARLYCHWTPGYKTDLRILSHQKVAPSLQMVFGNHDHIPVADWLRLSIRFQRGRHVRCKRITWTGKREQPLFFFPQPLLVRSNQYCSPWSLPSNPLHILHSLWHLKMVMEHRL